MTVVVPLSAFLRFMAELFISSFKAAISLLDKLLLGFSASCVWHFLNSFQSNGLLNRRHPIWFDMNRMCFFFCLWYMHWRRFLLANCSKSCKSCRLIMVLLVTGVGIKFETIRSIRFITTFKLEFATAEIRKRVFVLSIMSEEDILASLKEDRASGSPWMSESSSH